LREWTRNGTVELRLVERALIILISHEGLAVERSRSGWILFLRAFPSGGRDSGKAAARHEQAVPHVWTGFQNAACLSLSYPRIVINYALLTRRTSSEHYVAGSLAQKFLRSSKSAVLDIESARLRIKNRAARLDFAG
jgi:hypothetical protein